MGRKILLVWDRLGDYHRARAHSLQQVQQKYEVITADLGRADDLYLWETSQTNTHFFLSERAVDEADTLRRVWRFLKLILFSRVSVVGVAGYGRGIYIWYIILSKLFGKRVVVFAESWYGKRNLKNKSKSLFLSLFATSIFVSGERALKFFRQTLGLRSKRIEIGYSAVDNNHFRSTNFVTRDMKQYPHLLCVARFSKEKNHERMVDAFLRSSAAKHFHLKLVGAGPQFSVLQKRFSQRSEIIFADWTGYDQLPNLYRQSAALVLASTFEPWGLVVNEAMAAELPILLSKQVGCLPELAGNANSILFDGYRTQEIRAAFDTFSQLSLDDRLAMGKASAEKIKSFDTTNWAKTFLSLAKESKLLS